MDIAVAGHLCLDIIPRWGNSGIEAMSPGHLLEMDGIKFSTGGVVANTGLSLKKLGVNTGLFGKIGKDELGELTLNILKDYDENIIDNMIISPEETSAYTVVLNPPATDRIFLHYPGPNDTYGADDIDIKKIEDAKIFHFGYPPLMKGMYAEDGKELVDIYKKIAPKKLITSLDMSMPDPDSEAGKANWPKILKNVLPLVDIFLPSIEEILFMLGYENYNQEIENLSIDLLEEIGNKLIDLGVKIVMIKMGAQGIYLQTASSLDSSSSDLNSLINFKEWSDLKLFSPAFKTEVKGTTGAGDAAIAGFLADILTGELPETALKTAVGTGAFCVEAVDAVGGVVPLSKIKQRINSGWSRLPVEINMEEWIFDSSTRIWRPQQ